MQEMLANLFLFLVSLIVS